MEHQYTQQNFAAIPHYGNVSVPENFLNQFMSQTVSNQPQPGVIDQQRMAGASFQGFPGFQGKFLFQILFFICFL